MPFGSCSNWLHRAAALLLYFTLTSSLHPQDRPAPPTTSPEAALRRMGWTIARSAPTTRGSLEYQLRWQQVEPSVPTAAAPRLQVLSRIRRSQPPPRQRSQEMSPDHLLVVFLDRTNAVRYWQIVVDPRLVRGEFPDAQGNLSNKTLYRTDVTLSVTVPDGVPASEIRILRPSWDSQGNLQLSPLAELPLQDSQQ